MHVVGSSVDGPDVLVEFLMTAGTQIAPLMAPQDLQSAARLMTKYADTPMDFADASLILLADRTGVTDVITLDRRGFSTYRTTAGKPFRLVLPGR